MVSVRILDIIKEKKNNRGVILLGDETGRALFIFVAAAEAMAIADGIKKSQFPRPMTFDTACNLLKEAQVRISTVDISSLREGVFYSAIRFKSGESESEIDARPSDAMAIAVRLDVPIRVSEEVLSVAATESRHIPEKMKQASKKGWTSLLSEEHFA